MSAPGHKAADVRYEPNEHPPHGLALGLALQLMMLELGEIILIPVVVIRAAGMGDSYLAWAAFAALLISGITTMLQARRLGGIGAGYILLMVTSGAFIAVCVTALTEGGPALLMTLLIVSSLFQFLLAARLSLLRRIITPTVAGTVMMLIAVTIMPVVAELLEEVPRSHLEMDIPQRRGALLLTCHDPARIERRAPLGSDPGVLSGAWSRPVSALRGERNRRGCVVRDSAGRYPGFSLELRSAFWHAPAFVFVTLVGAIETSAMSSGSRGYRGASRARPTSGRCRGRSPRTASETSSPVWPGRCRTPPVRRASRPWRSPALHRAGWESTSGRSSSC